MKKAVKILAYCAMAEMINISASEAFFPIPVPIIGTDIANNAADLGENINAIGEELEQAEATLQKTIEEAKSGNFGFDAIKNYADTFKNINIDRIIPEIKLPTGIGSSVNDKDKTSVAVADTYIGSFSPEGNHTEQAKENKQKQKELLQMNVAAMYAHALASRANLAEEREMPATTLESKNTREIIQANRALSEKIAKRWNEILFMESQINEYNATQVLTEFQLSSDRAQELNIGKGKTEDKGENK